MAPKKKQNNNNKKKPQSSTSSSSGPRLQISAENENRLRRLLLNSNRSTQPTPPVQENLSKAQKAKRLKNVYEKLSCEGFSNDQIELALTSLKDNATFESALDWLCFNLPGNELPVKFSSGTSLYASEGSVSVVSTAREDRTPTVNAANTEEDVQVQAAFVRIKGRRDDDDDNDTSLRQPSSQADWIRQYMEQQEEEESETWEDYAVDGSFTDKVPVPRSYDAIAKEYYAARLEAVKAKEKGDKRSQEQSGHIIRKLKQELSSLGLSDDVLAQEFVHEHTSAFVPEGISTSSMPHEQLLAKTSSDAESNLVFVLPSEELPADPNDMESPSYMEFPVELAPSSVPVQGKIDLEDETADMELGGFFMEDATSNEALPPEVLELQKKEKMKKLSSEKNLEKLDGIWKKGDPKKIPKAVLHQLCQKSGWEAPKFKKVHERRKGFSYSVSILRKASGRGKSRKAGGLITLQLPDQDETYESAEDAQNRIAAFALHQLFPDLPVHLIVSDPYDSLILQWKEGESSSKVENTVDDRRAGFVDWLLNADESTATNHATNRLSETAQNSQVEETKNLSDAVAVPVTQGENYTTDVENSYLRQEQEKKKNVLKYREILKTRGALPIAGLKNEILQMLKENNCLVVCGETGSGKTTQVPQFILDDMIESGRGGQCNIICTQPRRIAAISVAERVAYERYEPPPGSGGSLVGYQVRLDSARNERTKLLFCTTGILLRRLAGDRNLSGITHVIVDEVHERSLLGDFLLIVLKSLLEKQSDQGTPKLKVILMSATVDSTLFSNYFGHCPVLSAQGRTHPVTTYFLEDIYESIDYHLASDSPAALGLQTSTIAKSGPVNDRRGKKNLVLSGWGDDSLLSEEIINPHFVSSNYQSYSEQTQKNLKRLDEDIIDYDLLEDLIFHVDQTYGEGAILVFLPGMSEIHMLLDRLVASYRFGGPSSNWVLPLHSSIASTDQKKVFLRPPENIRKVIIATNIAETSITIDDVVYVIDCGKHKENRYNPQKKLTSMVEDWISQANARQRRGRAGRVKPGICFCLYTCHRFKKLMRPYQVPEMLRMPLVELCLQIKILSLGHIKPFLSKALEPPRDEAMTSAISLLYEVGAIEGDEELTPLGHHLAKLPVDLLIGKMMLYGAIFGCLSPILSISAFLSYKSPFMYPKDEKQNVERAKLALLTDKVDGSNDLNHGDRQSDHIIMMVAYKKWDNILHEKGVKAAQQFCSTYFLSNSVMHMIRDMRIQFGTLLADIGFINLPQNYQILGRNKEKFDGWLSDKSQPFNTYSHHSSIVKAILCAGLYPNVAATQQGIIATAINSLKQSTIPAIKGYPVWYDGRREVHIHPSSINSKVKAFQHPFLVFLEKVETNKVFLRDTTIISPFSILLFGGFINVQHQTGLVTVDGWLKLTAPAQYAVLFKEFRSAMHSLLKELVQKPKNAAIVDNEVIKSMIQLLLDEDKPSK
ncbi:DExH-box ATP-dependent RNA helicase DExH7, chloroplastic isoform X1 [Ricinus communis]|uniref:DExH-box ATP-dependent RNA helicase DExH7, chloroplastic isoform X1 n=1 Tax=Ricinus communis TaxID=3988 RepID=UPI0007726F21|nr:DExH-box ATP-dependent RNA helicase DExH7, chloroplastic isoform X1 [Ricinus communis]|eukprot:XP_015580752.1 DExH-box ATP-dependent RNA helicase DExH7, chloroplastic isoform X1 [Ricinus communis]